MDRVMRAAKKLRVRVVAAHLPPGILGFYDKEAGIIYFDITLSPDERRSVVAHELGHVYYGHDCTTDRGEDQADAFAARLLIDPDRYAEAEAISTDLDFLADEMDVTVRIVRAFQKHALMRLGLRTYTRAPQVQVA